MAPFFGKVASEDATSAGVQIRELKNVDLNDVAAVEAAFAKAVARKAERTSINAARASVDAYRENMRKQKEGEQ
jgi:hypothetical protein